MKFKGKVAIWYWAVCILAEGTMNYGFFVDQEARIFFGDFHCVYESPYATNIVSELCSHRR